MPIQAIEPRRLYRQVADQLRALIDAGEYRPGSRLPTERDLAQRLGVSRPTVREALIALEVDGRIRIRVGSGIYVLETACARAGLSEFAAPAGPFELLEARALVEAAVAAAAADRATRCEIDSLDAALREMRDAEHPGPASFATDRAFHVAIATIAGNDVIVQIVGNLFDQRLNPYFVHLARYFETGDSWRAALDEHVAIRDCIAARDAMAASSAMRRHLANSQARFSHSFGPRSVDDDTDALALSTGSAPMMPSTARVADGTRSTRRRQS